MSLFLFLIVFLLYLYFIPVLPYCYEIIQLHSYFVVILHFIEFDGKAPEFLEMASGSLSFIG